MHYLKMLQTNLLYATIDRLGLKFHWSPSLSIVATELYKIVDL